MKALTLTQPWASLVALGAKRLETRSWATTYRGPLAIHAAKAYNTDDMIQRLSTWPFRGGLMPLLGPMGSDRLEDPRPWELLPYGRVIATGFLDDCRRTEDLTQGELDVVRAPMGGVHDLYEFTERAFGNFAARRFAFTLRDMRPIDPVPARGMLGLWDWSGA